MSIDIGIKVFVNHYYYIIIIQYTHAVMSTYVVSTEQKKTFDTVKLSICFHKMIHDGSIISIYNRPTPMLGEMFIIFSFRTL